MQALQYTRTGDISLIELPEPIPGEDEVIIKISYCGICGTDLHIIAGEAPSASRVVPGHEFSGHISSAGSTVADLKVGDLVAVDPNDHCGKCDYCLEGRVHFCRDMRPVGIMRNGGWAGYCAVPAKQVKKIPANVPPEWGALAEPLSCIVHGLDRLVPESHSQPVAVIGAGLIGLLWGLVLQNAGYTDLVFSEISQDRIKTARELNFNTGQPDEIFKQEDRFQIIIDCSGNPLAIEKSIPFLRPQGKLLLFGMCPQNSRINISPFRLFQKELSLIGSVVNPFTFDRAVDLIPQIMLPIKKLGLQISPLREYKNALEMARSARATKILFKP